MKRTSTHVEVAAAEQDLVPGQVLVPQAVQTRTIEQHMQVTVLVRVHLEVEALVLVTVYKVPHPCQYSG